MQPQFYANEQYALSDLPHTTRVLARDIRGGMDVAFIVWSPLARRFEARVIGQVHPDGVATSMSANSGARTVALRTNAGTFEFWAETWLIVYDEYADERRAREIDEILARRNLAIGALFACWTFMSKDGTNVFAPGHALNAVCAELAEYTGYNGYAEIVVRPDIVPGALDQACNDMRGAQVAEWWARACFEYIPWETYRRLLHEEACASSAFMTEDAHAFGWYGE